MRTSTVQYLETFTGYTVLYQPLPWQVQGLSYTRSGYGKRIPSPYCVRTDDGRVRRVYVTIYSNAGTAWVRYQGQTFVVLRTSSLSAGDRVERNPAPEPDVPLTR